MLKKIERPYWSGFFYGIDDEDTADLDKWFDEHIEPLNRLIENAVEVYSDSDGCFEDPCRVNIDKTKATHKALLVNVEPIKQETCADVLREFLDDPKVCIEYEFWERAKAALERERDGKND